VVRAELADVTTYTDVTPIRLPKGTVLNGAEISPILIGGEVPAGFGSGDVTMTVLSDASGYLVPNPYAGNNPNALRIVHLLMDVGIATSEPRANGAFTQDLLHIELVGLAEVDPTAGVLNLDAVSVVEPNILGQEYGYAMLSFQLQSYKDQNNPPQVTQDTIQPELQSWVPGDNAENFKVGDSIVLNFSESLARETVNSNSITLREQGGDIIPANIKVDGSALVIDPEKKLENTRQSRNDMNVINSHVYEISIGPGITDLAGNPYEPQQVPLQFELPTIVEMAHYTGVENGAFVNVKREIPNQSPIVLSTYPGYPCVLEETSIDLQNNIIGVCKSGMKSNYSSPDPFLNASSPVDPSDYERITRRPDDVMRLPYLPKNRPIIVQLSKPIDSASVENGKTFLVEKIDLSTSTSTSVDGQIAVQSNMIIFWPNQTWQDGQLYRYTISSTNDMTNSTTAICDGTQSVCDIDGLPIQTQLRKTEAVSIDNGLGIIETPVETNAGGPDMVQYFRGGAATDSVLQILSAPSSDNNANFFSEVNLENMLGQFPQTFNLDAKNFTAEEIGLGEAAPSDPNSCTGNGPCLDPEGIKPVPNSSKLLSKQTSGLKYLTINNGLQVPQIEGLNTGCGYESDMTTPSTCPKNKFVYLNSSIIAEVGNYNPQLDAIDVKIWPGQVMVTSIPTFAITVSGQFVLGVESGPQRMRMRYAKNDPNCIDEPSNPCLRSQPIQGWLGVEDGELNLRAQVDAYVDALALEDYLDLRPVISFQWHHELISVPVSLKLSGNVDFLPDGRMSVSQFNSNSIEIKGHIFNEDFSNTNLYAIGGLIDLEIPIGGAHIKYISKPIK